MIELTWMQKRDNAWVTLSPTTSEGAETHQWYAVKIPMEDHWSVFFDGLFVASPVTGKAVTCVSLHEAKCWVEDWERCNLQRIMERGKLAARKRPFIA